MNSPRRHPRTALAAPALVAAALLAVAAWPANGAASNATSVPRTCAAAANKLPSLTVTAGRNRVLRGAVRVLSGRNGWTVQAPLGSLPSYVSQVFSRSRQITVRFCLHAPRGVTAQIVRLTPSGISLVLEKRDSLRIAIASPAKAPITSRAVALTGRTTLVKLVADGARRQATLYVNGAKQQSVVVHLPPQTQVQLGNITPVRPSPPGKTNTVSLTGVTVSSGAGVVVPTPTTTSPSSPTPGSGAGPSDPTAWPGNPFSPSSFWNARLADDAPLDPQSSAFVTELARQVTRYKAWMNTYAYSVPVYVVPAGEQTQHVTLDTWGPDLQQAFDAVPIPRDAKSAAGTDAHMAVWQPATNKMWEFWKMQKESDGWHARWGGEMDDVSTNPGYFTHVGQTKDWGATATSLPLLGGLVTFADLQRGYINHALAIALVETQPRYWSWPAQRTDGGAFTSDITPIPEGTRFRLDPTLDVASLNLPPIDRMLALAAQKYGIVVRDKAGAVAFYGQDPSMLATNPWPAAFGDQWANSVLALFPWSHLEALRTELSCCWG